MRFGNPQKESAEQAAGISVILNRTFDGFSQRLSDNPLLVFGLGLDIPVSTGIGDRSYLGLDIWRIRGEYDGHSNLPSGVTGVSNGGIIPIRPDFDS